MAMSAEHSLVPTGLIVGKTPKEKGHRNLHLPHLVSEFCQLSSQAVLANAQGSARRAADRAETLGGLWGGRKPTWCGWGITCLTSRSLSLLTPASTHRLCSEQPSNTSASRYPQALHRHWPATVAHLTPAWQARRPPTRATGGHETCCRGQRIRALQGKRSRQRGGGYQRDVFCRQWNLPILLSAVDARKSLRGELAF